jgi:hypothetical protein
MENEKADVVARPSLVIKQVLVTAEIPTHPGFYREPGFDYTVNQTASFSVNTETWECKGAVTGLTPVLAEEQWWEDQCQRVSDRVKAALVTLTI